MDKGIPMFQEFFYTSSYLEMYRLLKACDPQCRFVETYFVISTWYYLQIDLCHQKEFWSW